MPEQPDPPKGPQRDFMKEILDDSVLTEKEKNDKLKDWVK